MSFQMGLIRKGKILDIDSNICMFVIHEKWIPDQKCKSIGTDIVKLTGERCVGIFQRDGTGLDTSARGYFRRFLISGRAESCNA